MNEGVGLLAYECTAAERRSGTEMLTEAAGIAARRTGNRSEGRALSFGGRRLLGWLLLVGIAVLAILSGAIRLPAMPFGTQPSNVWGSFGLFILGIACCFAGLSLIHASRRKRDARGSRDLRFSFDETGFTWHHPGRTETFRWPYYLGLLDGQEVFVLRVKSASTDGTLSGIILPKRLFPDDAERERFASLASDGMFRASVPLAALLPEARR